MEIKLKPTVFLKCLYFAGLFAIFTWWATIAITKFVNQPISTQISYKSGDDGKTIQFPHLTFCFESNYLFKELGNLSSCYESGFLRSVANCLESGLSLSEILKQIDYSRTEFIEKVGTKDYQKVYSGNDNWQKVYRRQNGLCHTFKLDEKFDAMEESPWIQMELPLKGKILQNSMSILSTKPL